MRIGRLNIEFYNPRRHVMWTEGIGTLGFREEALHPFAKADVASVIKMISDRLRNAEDLAEVEYGLTKALFAFLRRDRAAIMRIFFWEGLVRVDMSDPFCPRLLGEGVDCRDLREWQVVTVMDEIYRTYGKTRAEILGPQIMMLDTVNNADLNLLKNYGAMGLLSPENSAHADGYLDDDEKASMQEEYRKQYGITFGRWGIMITRNPVRFQPITLPIAQLQLVEKRKVALASILQFMNIPKELHAMFESAKYANRNEAELDMYGNCVSAWAESFKWIARKCYHWARTHDNHGIGYVADNDMWFDFVNVPALQEAQLTERVAAREELQMWREMLVTMPERADYINKRIDDLINRI